jgi:hypothetical protein
LDLVQNHGLVAELDEGLGEGEGLSQAHASLATSSRNLAHTNFFKEGKEDGTETYQWPQARAKAADENECCTAMLAPRTQKLRQRAGTNPSW